MSLKCKPYHIIDYGNNIIYCLSVIFNKAYLRHSGPARPAGGLDPESHTEFLKKIDLEDEILNQARLAGRRVQSDDGL